MMRILFIYYDSASSEPPRIGLGVGYLSAYLKRHGHEARLCYFRSAEDVAHALSIIREWQPGMVCHSSTSSSFASVREAAQAIGDDHGSLFQVCGGSHVSLCPEELEALPCLNAICIGYGEYPLLELVQALESKTSCRGIRNLWVRTDNGIVKNELRPFPSDLDEFLPADRGLFAEELKRFSIPVPFGGLLGDNPQEFIFCRGCPFDCTYCCNHALKCLGSGRYINFPSVPACIDALAGVKREPGMTGVMIHDDIFTLNRTWFRSFAEAYKAEIGLPYVCNLRVGSFDEQGVKALRESGCVIAIVGIESGNEHLRKDVLRRKMSNRDIVTGFELLHRYGIRTHSQNMIGLPGETPSMFLDTVRINAAIAPNFPTLSVFFPYPGTALHDKCVDEGLFNSRTEADPVVERLDTVLNLPQFPRSTILFYARNFQRLIEHETLSRTYRIIRCILPLKLGTQRIVAWIMSLCPNPLTRLVGWVIRAARGVRRPAKLPAGGSTGNSWIP